MANSIALAKIYVEALDEVYKEASKTSIFNNEGLTRPGSNANEVQIPKMTIQGLGDYSKSTGYADGDVTLSWETFKLTQDRARSLFVDRIDNQESMNVLMQNKASEFMRTAVVPEIDAYRIAKMASKAGLVVSAGATLSKSTVIAAFDDAIQAMDDAEVPGENRVALVTPEIHKYLSQADGYVRNLNGETGKSMGVVIEEYKGIALVKVPQTRMYTAITMQDGKTTGQEAGGYVKGGTAKDINFLIVQKGAVFGTVKYAGAKYISADENQDKDGDSFKYRIYHDLFVPDNKTNGIYLHHKA